jgi:cytochrome oxidase Cu insertion factor (SCO1/SenC/PrrC family)
MPNRHLWLTLLLLLSPMSVLSQEAVLAPLYQSPIKWTDDQGKPVSLSQWQGKQVIITMAYSTCRKTCPLTLAKLLQIQHVLDQRKLEAEIVVISYDPIDTWQNWAEYRNAHNLHRNNWHFLIGSPENTKTVAQLLGMDYWLYDEHVMHNYTIVRLGPNGDVVKTLGWDNKEQLESFLPADVKP